MSVLLGIGTFFLFLISIIMVLAILAQRTKSDGGVGAALGGGMAEAAFGAESGNILTKATTYLAVTFFVLSLGLYLGYIYNHRHASANSGPAMPTTPGLMAPAETAAPAATDVPATTETPAPEAATTETPAPAPEAAPAAPTANP